MSLIFLLALVSMAISALENISVAVEKVNIMTNPCKRNFYWTHQLLLIQKSYGTETIRGRVNNLGILSLLPFGRLLLIFFWLFSFLSLLPWLFWKVVFDPLVTKVAICIQASFSTKVNMVLQFFTVKAAIVIVKPYRSNLESNTSSFY